MELLFLQMKDRQEGCEGSQPYVQLLHKSRLSRLTAAHRAKYSGSMGNYWGGITSTILVSESRRSHFIIHGNDRVSLS